MDERLYKKIREKAYHFCKWHPDWEDVANEFAASWIERGNKARGQTIEQALIEALRRMFGRKGSQRYSINEAIRSAVRLDSSAFDGGLGHDFIGEQQIHSEAFGESRIDPDLTLGITCYENREDVSDSRNSQLRKRHNEYMERRYLWEHYKEYGIESEIEVDWIVL